MSRIEVLKTYKIYIGGAFPRTESGRFFAVKNKKGETLANCCLSSKKDVRNAVVAARKAFGAWAEKSAFNRSQILYRIAEMLEGRKSQFETELMMQGASKAKAKEEVEKSIDRIIYYAGWCDKYQQVASSVNPVASAHFNFSMLEPMGVVGIVAPADNSLLGLVSLLMPVIAGGNSCVVISDLKLPLCAITFAEVLNSSDVSGGVVNILTGDVNELAPALAEHMDVNALATSIEDEKLLHQVQLKSVENLKRVFQYQMNWFSKEAQSLKFISDFQEVKTTWHPIEKIGGSTNSY